MIIRKIFLSTIVFLSFSEIHLSSEITFDEISNSDRIKQAQEYFDAGEEEKALDLYLTILNSNPNHYTALWKTSLIYTRKARRQTTYEAQYAIYNTAKAYASKSLNVHPNRPRSHYVYALASAGLADDMPNSSERVRLIWDMKEYGERALQMDPDYAPAWHLMGVWHSKVGSVSRAERVAARVVYGTLPDGASHSKAEEFLKRAIRMDPGVILFHLDLAQHYQETGQRRKAIPVLEQVLTMQPVSQNDKLDLEEARERLRQLM